MFFFFYVFSSRARSGKTRQLVFERLSLFLSQFKETKGEKEVCFGGKVIKTNRKEIRPSRTAREMKKFICHRRRNRSLSFAHVQRSFVHVTHACVLLFIARVKLTQRGLFVFALYERRVIPCDNDLLYRSDARITRHIR